jgi:gliding motility-associated-like protein
MRKSLLTVFGKKAFVILLIAMSFVLKLQAQIDIAIGTGTATNTTTTYPCPLADWWEGSRQQYLYKSSELIAAGMGPGNINAIKFTVTALTTSTNAFPAVEQLTFKIGTTSATSLGATTWEPGTVTVYGPFNYLPVLGVNTFTFTSPFFWNGTDNIVVEMCNGDPQNNTDIYYTNNCAVTWTTGLSFNGSRVFAEDNTGNQCAVSPTTNGSATTTNTNRPNIIFNWTSANPCSGAPGAGTATATPSSVCLGENFTLSLTGNTVASGLSYQWQSSPDNVSWTNITGATTFSYTTTQSVTTYYRCVVTCANGGASSPSASVQVFSPTLVSGTYTINSALPTNVGTGTFNSFNDAYNYIKCGINGPVVFNVNAASGPYTEQLIMTPVPGASATNTITFNGNGRTIQFNSTNTNERAVIKLNGADHVRFNNLTIVGLGSAANEYAFGVQLINNADSNVVNGCNIILNNTSTATNFAGIVISPSASAAVSTAANALCDSNSFTNNTISGGYYGIVLSSSASVLTTYNRIANNNIKDFYQYGIYLTGTGVIAVDSNTISRPTRTTLTNFFGIYATGSNLGLNINRNTITNPYGAAPTSTLEFNGIYFTGVDPNAGFENVVSNNLIYNITGSGNVYGIYNSSSDGAWYYHNTIVIDGPAVSTTTGNFARGFYQTLAATGLRFVNNIVTISRGGPGTKHCIYLATPASTFIAQKNDYFISAPLGNNYIGFLNTNQATLVNWQNAFAPQDFNSVSTNPVYLDPLNGNYKPTSASIDNLGLPVGITTDILGQPRSATTPDIGAYEFIPPPCQVPPVPGTATVSSSPVCEGVNVALSVTGNSIGLNQTYQWQVSSTLAGPYTSIGNILSNPDTTIVSTVTQYYRLAVTCSGNTTYSVPVLLSVNPRLPGGTYTINSAVPTGGTNYQSYADAKFALRCGIAGPVVFNVAPGSGPYNEQLILDSIPGTSPVNTITFKGNGTTIAYSSSNNTERAVIKLRGADYIIFDSLRINATGAGTYGYGVQLFNRADSNIFRKCVIIANNTSTSTNYSGIVINASETGNTTTGETLCDGNLFDRNIVSGGYAGATVVGSTTGTLIEKNSFTNNIFQDYYLYGIYISGTNSTLVEANKFMRPTRNTGITTFYGVYVTGYNNNLNITRNKITNPFGGSTASTSTFYGIYFTGVDAVAGSENKVTNNLIYKINGEGPQYGIYNTSSDNVRYYHNTITLDNAASTSTSLTRGFYQITAATGIVFKNNIITIFRGGTGAKHCVYLDGGPAGMVFDKNNYYIGSTAGTNNIGYNGLIDLPTINDWKGATGVDANSFSYDPAYADIANDNYTPQLTPFDNTADPVGVLIDILGAPRSATTPDVGAFEFSLPPCIVPPVGGTASVTPNSGMCLGATISLSLSGNSVGGGQTYQWQSAPSATGPWTNISPVQYISPFVTTTTTNTYFRCEIVCSGNTSYSSVTQVTLNALFPAGVYTIDRTLPTNFPGGFNFNTFAEAVTAMACGITGPVTFNVAANTYNEQILIKNIPGSGDAARVTFQSANGNAASVTLTYNASAAANYTLKLDSASYITFKNMSIVATNTTYGRAIELANTASKDSILNCNISVPAVTGTATGVIGIYSNALKGSENVIKGNTISNGIYAVYFSGTSATVLTKKNVIDSNTINGSYYYGIYTSFSNRMKVRNNTVNRAAPQNATSYGIYMNNADTAYEVTGNIVNINNSTGTVYGIYMNANHATATTRGKLAGNTVIAQTGNTGTLYGIYQATTTFSNTVNNVVSINTSSTSSYGIYHASGGSVNYYNNSVNNTSATGTNSYAMYIGQTSGTRCNFKNNIFAHNGGGKAMYMANVNFAYSDYNMLYTSGATLVTQGANNYANLELWRNASFWDVNSIVYKPAFTSNTDLRPNLASPDVWAIHGRGVQIADNDYDFNNNPRPTTLTTGVPDLGAYEFLPTSLPTPLTAIPATPVANSTQVFMYGTDTVSKITWGANVPASITGRRYSGVIPPGVAPNSSMYYYVDFDTTGTDALNYKIDNYFIDPWQGFIPSQSQIKLGRTDASAAWITAATSTVDDVYNIISEANLSYIDKYTGLKGGTTPGGSIVPLAAADSSNRGTQFWVMYGHNYYFGSDNSQQMALYLSTGDAAAHVTVKINGTSWKREYSIPANTVVVCDSIPKSGVVDARILEEGWSDRGISISADTPIVAYAHCYGGATSGASLLLPVGTYGYEYYSINIRQNYSTGTSSTPTYSWFNIIANYDSTLVEITPSNPTVAGRPAGVPFQVYLNKGEVYQVLGAYLSPTSAQAYDLTGSKVRSIANASGRCFPIAMFSGSSRTGYGCNGTSGGSGDYMIQQNFPSQAWGKRYLTAATATDAAGANVFMTNIYRVIVKDPTTVVTRNGSPLTGLINNLYYEFESNSTDEIKADKPITVAQYMSSSGGCPNTSGDGDPEMIFISPIEQGINKIALYRNNRQAIDESYLTLIVPTAGLSSLLIDGAPNAWTYAYDHVVPGYKVVNKRWSPAGPAQAKVTCDSNFTAITYGLGSVESYGYNAGTLVKNLNVLPSINNVFSGTGGASPYTCAKTPFRFKLLLPLIPTQLIWQLSAISNLTPNTDVTQNNPTPADSTIINNVQYYVFTLPGDYQINTPGTYVIPIIFSHPSIEGCTGRLEQTLTVTVLPSPVDDFTVNFTGCIGDVAIFTGTGTTSNAVPMNQFIWDFGDATNATGNPVNKLYATPGTYNVKLRGIAADGCIADTVKPVTVFDKPIVDVVPDSLNVCQDSSATFFVQNPVTGVTYNWFDAPTGGTQLGSGTSYTIPSVNGTVQVWVEANRGGCISNTRKRVVAKSLPVVGTPVAVVDSVGTNVIRFRWNAVANAIGYQVSLDNGATWITPSSGPTGLTHTITGLQVNDTRTLIVRALGGCDQKASQPVSATTFTDQIFIPNSFTPNGDGRNDKLFVYGYIIKSMRFVVFNQWGEKIFESKDQSIGWDGTYKGKPQPSGVYIYVCELNLTNGTTLVKKGSINLIR